MSHFVAYILLYKKIIMAKIPPEGGGGCIAIPRTISIQMSVVTLLVALDTFS